MSKRNNIVAFDEVGYPLYYQMRDKILLEAYPDENKPTEESLGEILNKDPGRIFQLAGMEPDPWQLDLLTSQEKQNIILCTRQSGKSFTAAAMAIAEALGNPPAEILILSKAQRQSKEVLRKAWHIYQSIQGDQTARAKIKKSPRTLRNECGRYNTVLKRLDGVKINDEDRTQRNNTEMLEFKNGSRIISLPGNADTSVGFSAISLLIIDEAARTPDQLFAFLSPTRAVTEGKLVALSTPFGKRGWFYEAWTKCEEAKKNGQKPPWKQIKIPASQCPRISKRFLDDERANIGNMWFSQEYDPLVFLSVVNSVFDHDDIMAAFDPGLQQLIIPGVDDVRSTDQVVDSSLEQLEVMGVDS